MDKLDKLKCILIDSYGKLVRMAQRGYPIANYCKIKEAMLAINYIENFDVPTIESITVIDKYSYELNI